MKFCSLLICTWMFAGISIAQNIPSSPNQTDSNGLRQGKWTVLFNQLDQRTSHLDSAHYYALITYEDDRPVGVIYQYDSSGNLVSEYSLIQDRPNEILDGEYTEYGEDGIKELSRYYSQGRIANFEDAISWFRAKVDKTAATLGKDHPDYAHYLNTLAISYTKQGLYAKAEPLYTEAIDQLEATLGTQHVNYISTIHNLGKMYYYQGLYEKAEDNYLKVLALQEETSRTETTDYLTTLNNISAVYFMQGQLDKTEEYMTMVLKATEKLVGKEHRNYATALNNLASINMRLNNMEKAIILMQESLVVYEKTLTREHPQYTTTLNNLAYLYKISKNYSKSEEAYLEAKAIEEQIIGPYHGNFAYTLNQISDLYLRQGLYEKAEPYMIQGADVLLHQTAINFSQLSEAEKGKYLRTFSYNFERFYSFAINRMVENPEIISEAYRISLATKGILFDSQQKIKNRILNSKDSTLTDLYKQWVDQRAYLSGLFEKTNKELEATGISIEAEEKRLNSLEKQLSAQSEMFASALEHVQYGWRDIQASLKKGEAALELVRFRYFEGELQDSVVYAAMIITPTTKDSPVMVVLPDGKKLEGEHLNFYRNSIRFETKDTRSYAAYWQDIQRHLAGIEKVYFSADGIYHNLNISGMWNDDKGLFVGDEMDIHQITSTRQLALPGRDRSPQKEVLLLGYPTYNIDDGRSNQDSLAGEQKLFNGEISVLPGTIVEINAISRILKDQGFNASKLLEEAATESSIRETRDPMILHIATHGYFLDDTEIEGQFIAGMTSETMTNNPLLRSGLLLAGAQQAIDHGGDGILTAYEAKGLNLDETELVVLSACETGLGEIKNGEGVYGLQRAFRTAGAATILMSLWTVSDEATQLLMTRFYENWLLKEQGKREAFMNAQRELRGEFAHPYYWAAFVMVGE